MPVDRDPQNSRLRFLADAITDGKLVVASGDVNGTRPGDGLMVQIRHLDLRSFAEREQHADLLRFAEEWRSPSTRGILAKPKGPRHVAAILQLNYNGAAGLHSTDGSKNVELAEQLSDGRWLVQFIKWIDPDTLTVRRSWGDQKVELLECSPKQATIRLLSPTPLEDLYSRHPVQVVFEFAEIIDLRALTDLQTDFTPRPNTRVEPNVPLASSPSIDWSGSAPEATANALFAMDDLIGRKIYTAANVHELNWMI